jgi:hypothetical protein
LAGVKLGLADAIRQRPGQVDYRLARQHALHAYKAGELSRMQVCDAQSELRRNAEHCGPVIEEPCPVCDEPQMHCVTYVFGPRLPSGGRCVTSRAEMTRLARRKAEYKAYEVEVCIECGWNHLLRSYLIE